jgi:hypothetical protein
MSGDGIERAVEEALAALDASPDGWLDLSARRRLRSAFGPWTPPYEPGGPDAGLLRRAALQVATVRRAASSWERRFPGDLRPRELADAVMPALRGEVREERVKDLAAELERDVEPLGAEVDAEDGAFFAGLAAVYLSTEAWDGDLDPEGHPPERTDRELDEPRVEALAASAVAADGLEDPRSFWHWYVTEAFPAAYGAAP